MNALGGHQLLNNIFSTREKAELYIKLTDNGCRCNLCEKVIYVKAIDKIRN